LGVGVEEMLLTVSLLLDPADDAAEVTEVTEVTEFTVVTVELRVPLAGELESTRSFPLDVDACPPLMDACPPLMDPSSYPPLLMDPSSACPPLIHPSSDGPSDAPSAGTSSESTAVKVPLTTVPIATGLRGGA
jgi:hypothetical protein